MTHDEAINRVAELADGRHCSADLSYEHNLLPSAGRTTVYKVFIRGLDVDNDGRRTFGWFYGESFDDVVGQVERAVNGVGFAD